MRLVAARTIRAVVNSDSACSWERPAGANAPASGWSVIVSEPVFTFPHHALGRDGKVRLNREWRVYRETLPIWQSPGVLALAGRLTLPLTHHFAAFRGF